MRAVVSDKPRTMNVATLLGVGATFGLAVGVGAFLGVLADHRWGTSPLLALLGVALGILGGAAGAYQVIRPYTRTTPVPTPTTQSARPDDSAD
jgi:F0F1-type ATP synthase assembly protein I